MKRKLALFDFCETLVDFQTADNFVHFIRKNESSFSMNMKESVRMVLVKSGIMKILEKFSTESFNKKFVLWQIKGFDANKLDQYAKKYYSEKIRPAFIKKVLSEMKNLKKKGSEVYVASGGYDIYLKEFVKEFELNGVVCTKVLFKGGKCCGKFDGGDCLGENKIKLLDIFFSDKKINDYDTISYSDSITDLPLLKWTNKGIVVSKNKVDSWVKKNKLGELVWGN